MLHQHECVQTAVLSLLRQLRTSPASGRGGAEGDGLSAQPEWTNSPARSLSWLSLSFPLPHPPSLDALESVFASQHQNTSWIHAANALPSSSDPLAIILTNTAIASLDAEQSQLAEELLLLALYLRAHTPSDIHINEIIIKGITSNNHTFAANSRLRKGLWRDAFTRADLRIAPSHPHLAHFCTDNNLILERIRVHEVPSRIARHLLQNEHEAIAQLLSTSYFTILDFIQHLPRALDLVVRNLAILDGFSADIPPAWFTQNFLEALRVALDASCGLLIRIQNGCEEDLGAEGVQSICKLMSAWLDKMGYMATPDAAVLELVKALLGTAFIVSGPRVREECVMAYLELLLKLDGKVSDAVDVLVSDALQSCLQSHTANLSATFLTHLTSSLAQHLATTPRAPLTRLLRSLVPVRHFYALRDLLGSVARARWEAVDSALLRYEQGILRRAVDTLVGRPGEARGRVVTVLPVWVSAFMEAMQDVGGVGACALGYALMRAVTEAAVRPAASEAIVKEIVEACVGVLERSAGMLGVAVSEDLETAVAELACLLFALHGDKFLDLYGRVALSSDTLPRALLHHLMHILHKYTSPTPTPADSTYVAILSRALAAALRPHTTLLRNETVQSLSALATQLSQDFRAGRLVLPAGDDSNLIWDGCKISLFSLVLLLQELEIGAEEALRVLRDVHFVTCRFGVDAFPAWGDLFYGLLDGVVGNGRVEEVVEIFCSAEDGPEKDVLPRRIFSMLVIQHLLPSLTANFVADKVMPLCAPHLSFKPGRGNDELDLFEMSHWIYYRMFSDVMEASGGRFREIVCARAREYTSLLIENFNNGDDVENVRRQFSACIKALTCFSSPVDPGLHVRREGRDLNWMSLAQEEVADLGVPVLGSRSHRGGIRAFGRRRLKKVRDSDALKKEVETVGEWDPWEGDRIAWGCVGVLVERVEALTRKVHTGLESRQQKGGEYEVVVGAAVGNKRMEEIFSAAPILKLMMVRDGLLMVLFNQIRTVGLPDVERVQQIVRRLLFEGVEVSKGDDGESILSGGIGLEMRELSKTSLWNALFDAVSGDRYYDIMRQVQCVEWYMKLTNDARCLIAEKGRETEVTETGKDAALIRAKL
ncbi:hypothetical protein BC830DRAFT_1126634 [Chytriomyces sp. MP71]|nr:hypothetical protein BC830DRAFT_1126634 [Chytriomyces sp. MP71]